MQILKWAGIAVGGVLVVLVAVGFMLPREIHVERTVMIDAPAEEVYAIVSDMNRFNEWSPWYEHDPDADYNVEGEGPGVGQKMVWASDNPNVGSGSQEIVEAVPSELVRTKLSFDGQGEAIAYFDIRPAQETESVSVTWGFDTDMGVNPIGRYLGLMMDKWVGGDYESGLAKLKNLAEANGAADGASSAS